MHLFVLQELEDLDKWTFNSPYLGFFLASHVHFAALPMTHVLSIPLTWDFSLHLPCWRKKKRKKRRTFNSPYLGFFLASNVDGATFTLDVALPFNSPYLGFFLASEAIRRLLKELEHIFQFPLLGIFPCIRSLRVQVQSKAYILSIPLTWDFSLHLPSSVSNMPQSWTFNSPYLGFFLASPLQAR